MSNSEISNVAPNLFEKNPVEMKYVAFCDILGFSNLVTSDFDNTLSMYKAMASTLASNEYKEVMLTMYSDSILITADSLPPILRTVKMLWFYCLTHNFMLRGGISYGKYWEERSGRNLLVVSDALINAVKLENMVSVPSV